MLRPDEFTVGPIADAQPLSLVLPRSKYEEPLLVIGEPASRVAVFIGDRHRFDSMACEGNRSWKGLIVPGVRVEVDETSLFDPETEYAPNGALVREGEGITMAVKARGAHGFSEQARVPLVSGLHGAGEQHRVGFRRWQVVLGEGDDKRVLCQVRADDPQASDS
jgi:hypothetical protein